MSGLTHHPFTLRQLQYVVAVADALSFRKAAERCGVSQPSLSAQLLQVEDSLGVRLFERNRRRVLVTPAGQEVVARAQRVLVVADDVVVAARRATDPLDGTLRIGVIPTVAPYLLPSLARTFRAAHPHLTTMWIEDKTESLVAALDRGGIDAALFALEADIGDVDHERIAVDPFVLAARPDHPLVVKRGALRPKDLEDAPVLLLDDGHCLRDQALSFCKSTKANELAFRATSLATLSHMVAGGAGITLLPRIAVATEAARAGLGVRAFVAPSPRRTLILAWRRGSPLAAALRRLARTVRTAVAKPTAP